MFTILVFSTLFGYCNIHCYKPPGFSDLRRPWVIIIFLADAQDTSTIVSSALWNNTKGAIHNRRFTAQTLIKLLVANELRHERMGSLQKSDKTLFTSFMDGLQDPLRPHLLGKNIICLLPS